MKPNPRVAKQSAKKRTLTVVATAEEPKELRRIIQSAKRNELVIIAGTGTSLALTDGKIPALSWKGLIEDGFVYARTKGLITAIQVDSWNAQLNSQDMDDLLGAAEFVGRKLGAPQGDLYARWLEKTFKGIEVTNQAMAEALRLVQGSQIPICTLNYDHL